MVSFKEIFGLYFLQISATSFTVTVSLVKLNITKDLEHVRNGEKEFIDERGKISNHELPEPVNLIGLIDSKKGTARANHYHPIQEQKCLVTKGQFISVYQDLLNKNSPKITHVVDEGQLIVTKPNTAHTMVFSKDTVFLNLVREKESMTIME